MVKNTIKTGNAEGREEKDAIYGTEKNGTANLTGKPILPDENEIKQNTRAHSAKLRVGERI